MLALHGLIFLAIFSCCRAVSVKPEHSLNGPYEADGENLQNWDLTGSAQLGDSYIRLTTDEEEKQGAIWNTIPSYANNWEFHAQINIHGKGVHLNGDGMALWYVREEDILHGGPVFGAKDYFSGLGVFIDTFRNRDEPSKDHHPYISAMVNNGSLHYDSDEDGAFTQIGGCHAAVRNLEVPLRIAISYLHSNLGLYVDNHGTGQWNLCFKREGVFLPTGYFFGISASTSDMTDNHDVIGVTYLNFDPDNVPWIDNGDLIPEVKNLEIPQKYHKDIAVEEQIKKIERKREAGDEDDTSGDESSGSSSLVRKLIYATGGILIILVAISVYRKYSEKRKERMDKRLF